MKKKAAFILIITTLGIGLFCAAQSETKAFKISKHFNILHSLFRELDFLYVDSVDIDKVFLHSIEGMLAEYDPYTEYIPAEEVSDFNYITTGEYAGIGALISKRPDGRIVIGEPYEHMPAQQAGLRYGDELIEIDGQPIESLEVAEVSNLLRGQPNTKIKVTIRRNGEKKPIRKEITRKRIVIDQVEFADMVAPEVGYIFLNGFTERSSQEVEQAMIRLKQQGAKRLILDLRENGGGLLTEAVSICNLFIEKGELIVSTKGKVKTDDRLYRTMREALDTEMPLAILINGNSASSSEIVAGALQDLDRAVVIGERSYGKGLVQTTQELPYGGLLKVTTARYYIPSQRCIQAIDYIHRNDDGSAQHLPDSLANTFYTRAGRPVKDGGGIQPDVEVSRKSFSDLSFRLVASFCMMDFTTDYVLRHDSPLSPDEITLTDADYDSFKQLVMKRGIDYDRQSRRALLKLKNLLEWEGYSEVVAEEIASLEQKLDRNLEHDLELFRPEIESLLRLDIAQYYFYKMGQHKELLRNDPCLEKAIEVLSDSAYYRKLLSAPTTN